LANWDVLATDTWPVILLLMANTVPTLAKERDMGPVELALTKV
jgi:hypothetical protein